MSEIQISNIEDALKKLRLERSEIERREQGRQEEYDRATQLYSKSLTKETEAFAKSKANYDRRNASFKEEVDGIINRTRMGAYALNKTSKRMQDERDKINMILMETYPKLAARVKEKLILEKQEIAEKLKKAKEENSRIEQSQISEGQQQINLAEIRDTKNQLDQYLKESKNAANQQYQSNKNYLEKVQEQSQSYLDEFMSKPDPNDIQYGRSNFGRLDPSYPNPEKVLRNELNRDPTHTNYPPKTDILSNFLRPPSTMRDSNSQRGSPIQQRNQEGNESLMYSPVTANENNESRISYNLSAIKTKP